MGRFTDPRDIDQLDLEELIKMCGVNFGGLELKEGQWIAKEKGGVWEIADTPRKAVEQLLLKIKLRS